MLRSLLALLILLPAGPVGPARASDVASAQSGNVMADKKLGSTALAATGAPLVDGDEFGDSVAGLGDLDRTGPAVAALAVGAIGDDDGGAHRGAVRILFLDPAGDVLSVRKISDTRGGFQGVLDDYDEFGGSVAFLGDLDGAGPSVGAIAVGAVGDDDGGLDRGAVYVLLLDATGAVLSERKVGHLQGGFTGVLDDGDEFGGSVAGLGDLDGPGPSVAALAVGAMGDDDGGSNRGAVYILSLSASGLVLSHQKISDTAGGFTATFKNEDNFGEDVASLGDLDGPGPGVRALAVSAIKDDDGGNDRGAVYVLFLSASASILGYAKISDSAGGFTGPLANDDNFGTGLAALGDLDGSGPGVGALAVSAGGDDGIGVDRGAVYVLVLDAGGQVLTHQETSSTAGFFAGGLSDLLEFGSALGALGDINGAAPGAQTLVAGVGYDDEGGPDRGAVHLMTLQGGPAVTAVAPGSGGDGTGLGRLRPNPSRSGGALEFRTATPGRVRIALWDAGGRHVRTLVDGRLEAGEHRAAWDGRDAGGRPVAAGTYFVRMSLDGRPLAGVARAVVVH